MPETDILLLQAVYDYDTAVATNDAERIRIASDKLHDVAKMTLGDAYGRVRVGTVNDTRKTHV